MPDAYIGHMTLKLSSTRTMLLAGRHPAITLLTDSCLLPLISPYLASDLFLQISYPADITFCLSPPDHDALIPAISPRATLKAHHRRPDGPRTPRVGLFESLSSLLTPPRSALSYVPSEPLPQDQRRPTPSHSRKGLIAGGGRYRNLPSSQLCSLA